MESVGHENQEVVHKTSRSKEKFEIDEKNHHYGKNVDEVLTKKPEMGHYIKERAIFDRNKVK